MMTYEAAALLSVAMYAFGMACGVLAVALLQARKLPMPEAIEHFDPIPWCDRCSAYVGVKADCYFTRCPRRV
jgi:hypothetical protein